MAWSWLWKVLGFFLASRAATRLAGYEVDTLKAKGTTEGTHPNQSGPPEAVFYASIHVVLPPTLADQV